MHSVWMVQVETLCAIQKVLEMFVPLVSLTRHSQSHTIQSYKTCELFERFHKPLRIIVFRNVDGNESGSHRNTAHDVSADTRTSAKAGKGISGAAERRVSSALKDYLYESGGADAATSADAGGVDGVLDTDGNSSQVCIQAL